MFRTNIPVTAEAFFGREAELNQLATIVSKIAKGEPSWLAILGLRKIGKTSLLLEMARRNANPSVVFVVLDTFEEIPPSLRIYRTYALRVLDAVFASELGASLEAVAHRPSEFRAALQLSSRFTSLPPGLRARILEVPDRTADENLLRDALLLPEELAQALNIYILVAWDEFQELASFPASRGAPDPLPLMRSLWQKHHRVSYIISGSQRTTLSQLISKEHAPFFQHFSIMELGPFPDGEAIRLLMESPPDDRPIPEPLARKAVEVFGGHPFYLQLLGDVLTGYPPPYDESSLKEAIQELLFSRTGRLSLYFENIHQGLVGRSSFLAAVLQALASGSCRLTDLAHAIGAPTGSTVRYVERLHDAVFRNEAGLYALSDPILALWLRWRQPGGTVVPMLTIGDEAEKLVAEHLARMGFDLVYQSRASRGAFDLLATRGSVQLGIQVKRSKLPIRFNKTAWNRMIAEAKRFGWRWVIAAVAPDEKIFILSPDNARVGKEIRLQENAAIDNLLLWLEDTKRGA